MSEERGDPLYKQLIEETIKVRGEAVDLGRMNLGSVPDEVRQLTWLRKLDLSCNQLVTLPAWLANLRQLEVLSLHQNPLTELPDWLDSLKQLRALNVGHALLSVIPDWLAQLTRLRILDFSENNLTALPEWLGQLAQLQRLSLSHNHLRRLPASLGRLSRLTHLNLYSNQLETVPDSLGELIQLEELVLSENRLAVLPDSLPRLRILKQLYLHGNEALRLPSEVLGPTIQDVSVGAEPSKPSEILNYYFRARGGSRPLNEAKLILVGRGNVGKTCVVNRLVYGHFNPKETKTDGIRITQWKVTLDTHEEMRLNIWDFGGQEIMHSTHQFFLTQRSLYLLVLNGRDGSEDSDAEYWLQLIESFGGESPVLVVLNKIKAHPFDLNRRALQRKYVGIQGFIRTDCRDNTGLAELASAIRRETDLLEDVRASFPASWVKVKDHLAVMKESYLNFEQYSKLCNELGEPERDAQEYLAANLHRLGIALNFRDDPRLRDTHVLNPHWITNGIYKILNSENLESQKGILHLSDLDRIIDRTEYPPSKHLFLIDLMKKFELCFEFPEDPQQRYLVPELLDKEEPDLGEDFQPKQCLNFEYHYSILPEGLLPRFIVRTHIMSPPALRWRTGVVLEFEDNRALVTADARDRKVIIRVTGPAEGRRRLLAVIRSDFEAIHRDIRKLQVTEMVPVSGHPEVVIPYSELTLWERKGETTLRRLVGNDILNLDVRGMLNGVDLEDTRPADSAPWWVDLDSGRRPDLTRYTKPLRVFVSYSHKDDLLRSELETHLKLLQRQSWISVWTDRRITAGEEWKGPIDANLESADIILLLLSSDFVASDYCYNVEMKCALKRHEAKSARVIPVILRDVDWHSAPFGKLQALPKDGRPVTLWDDRDSAWRDVATGIRKVAEQIRPRS